MFSHLPFLQNIHSVRGGAASTQGNELGMALSALHYWWEPVGSGPMSLYRFGLPSIALADDLDVPSLIAIDCLAANFNNLLS